jgi:hypothetical protein
MTTHKDRLASKDLGANLERIRKAHGAPSYPTVHREVIMRLGHDAPAHQTIRNWHQGQMDPHGADLATAAALADFYEVSMSDLHPVLGRRWGRAEELARITWYPFLADRRRLTSAK